MKAHQQDVMADARRKVKRSWNKRPTKYPYHRAYVKDLHNIFGHRRKPKERRQAFKRGINEDPSISFPVEIHNLKREKVSFAVSAVEENNFSFATTLMIFLRKAIILRQIKDLIKAERDEEYLD
eukprot:CAMPEP_0116543480 /NCGR_PEP_ID=MMETSP0397-20121206/1586_1 /TAXON_ID=216820 /ORGANISM="Cyclophora tenuis, Strain ECT3854" /LENGTH=123 /DNA_ID=CAMNT_0004067587 /DNA_START=380 /DNA_END=751 /DNA_ORIENTATION=+